MQEGTLLRALDPGGAGAPAAAAVALVSSIGGCCCGACQVVPRQPANAGWGSSHGGAAAAVVAAGEGEPAAVQLAGSSRLRGCCGPAGLLGLFCCSVQGLSLQGPRTKFCREFQVHALERLCVRAYELASTCAFPVRFSVTLAFCNS